MKILNVAAGKELPLIYYENVLKTAFLINLDTMYYMASPPDFIESESYLWEQKKDQLFETVYCNEDAFKFLERTKLNFNYIAIYRFLEHISFNQILYFIYLLSTCTYNGSTVDVIVPNYKTLSQMILDEDKYFKDNNMKGFEAHNILTTTELLNEPSCPHASIWTSDRAKYFFELEKRFEVTEIDPSFSYDGRDIYLRFKAQRI